MNVGELFIDIGIKGAQKVGQALKGITTDMGDFSNKALLGKSAVAGVFYGIEQMMTKAADAGMTLERFTNLTGLNTDEVQKWQVVLNRAGVTADEVTSSFTQVASAVAKIKLAEGSNGFTPLMRYTKDFDFNKVDNPNYIYQKAQELTRSKEIPISFQNEFLRKAGFSDQVIAGLRSATRSVDQIRPGEILSKATIKQNSAIKGDFLDLQRRFLLLESRTTSKYGRPIEQELGRALSGAGKLISVLEKFSQTSPNLAIAMTALSVAIGAAFFPWTAAAIGLTAALSYFADPKNSLIGKLFEWRDGVDQKILGPFQKPYHDALEWLNKPHPFAPGVSNNSKPATVNQINNLYGVEHPHVHPIKEGLQRAVDHVVNGSTGRLQNS